jgi:hypothetical protein
MQLQQWILFGVALVIILLGAALMIYGAVARRARVGKDTSEIAQILKAIAEVVKAVGDIFGANLAAKVGFVLVVCGFGLLVLLFTIDQ